jgi:YYY domain-containing protein
MPQPKNAMTNQTRQKSLKPLLIDLTVGLLLLAILFGGWYLRNIGLEWDQNYHLHPDERFLTMLETAIQPVGSLSEYFNTNLSTLNPHNVGYSFFVYGTLPIFITRYIAQWINRAGFDQIAIVGRLLSSIFDVGTVLLIYLIAVRLYRKPFLGLFASAFYSFAVLPIQLSHFFVVDTFTNFFGFLAFYFAAVIFTSKGPINITPLEEKRDHPFHFLEGIGCWFKANWQILCNYLLFGFALGLAMASKLNAVYLALLIVVAVVPYLLSSKTKHYERIIGWILPAGILSALVAFLTFRIFQPYAFKGPSFFNFGLNPRWLANLAEQNNLSSAAIGFPPSVQWVNRPIWFSLKNMIVWGLGTPLGFLVCAGFLFMVWRTIKGEWKKHLLLVIWTGVYFALESFVFNRTMRYQMLVYPSLAIIGAWTVDTLWVKAKGLDQKTIFAWVVKVASVAIPAITILATMLYAFAFSRIYTRPITRIEASEWIYQNVPGPINLKIQNNTGSIQQAISYPLGGVIGSSESIRIRYIAPYSGEVVGVNFSYMVDPMAFMVDPTQSSDIKTLQVVITDLNQSPIVSYQSQVLDTFDSRDDPRGKSYHLLFDPPLTFESGKVYEFNYRILESGKTISYFGPNTIDFIYEDQLVQLPLPEPVMTLHQGMSYSNSFTPIADGKLTSIEFPHITDWTKGNLDKQIRVTILTDLGNSRLVFASGVITDDFSGVQDIRGDSYQVKLSQPVTLMKDRVYTILIEFVSGSGSLAIYGSRQANESSWDDPLPYGVYGINAFDYYNGVYRTDLNFEIYWDDNADKLTRMLSNLEQADYIFISSNRQWGSLARLPDQYPLTTEFYRNLIGCPAGDDILYCYSVAQPGMYAEKLGFNLVQVFTSEPSIGPFSINSQFAEEAFTVYDHPKVLIFHKTEDFNLKNAIGLLSNAGLKNSTTSYNPKVPTGLMLTTDSLKRQQAGGTWSQLFDVTSLMNKYPGLGVVIWYLFILLIGWIVYPTVRIVFSGLKDRGYGLSKLIGMLLVALFVWWLGSLGLSVSKLLIGIVLGAIFIINAALFILQRDSIINEIREKKMIFLLEELIALCFFIYFLLVRLGNPDLWHPWKGGEKPMDFSYFNAVLKSTTFPPYDPWFAGGYINYYYYGFVIAGMPVKFLGIVPSIAYDFILPTFFSFTASGAFCAGWNLVTSWLDGRSITDRKQKKENTIRSWLFKNKLPIIAGLLAIVLVLILGNLGTIRMIWQGFQKLATGGASIDNASIIQRWIWTFQGIGKFIKGEDFLYAPGDYYWIPSRAIPGDAITEFPYFTFLYGDPHAHMFALPITLLAIAWAVSMFLKRWDWSSEGRLKGWVSFIITFFIGGVIIGSLRPTNTWDLYTYLPLGIVAVGYSAIKHGRKTFSQILRISPRFRHFIIVAGSILLLIAFTLGLYYPFSHWFAQGYNQIEFWKYEKTPFWSYVTHWGLFLFIIISWLVWELRSWMASTPASVLKKIKPYQEIIWLGVILFIILIIVLLILGVRIAWLVIPCVFLSGMLALRPDFPDAKRAVAFLVTLGLTLTLMVELFAVKGDIGRMNMVFKIYLQAWVILGISAASSLVFLFPSIFSSRSTGFKTVWQSSLILLFASAAFFTLTATIDKIRDRFTPQAPHVLDGMTFMPYSTYFENNTTLSLDEDYRAIRWMQQNVQGSPVIVEGNVTEYRWGSRYTIYTGLPGVVGWNWHQRQQRGVVSADDVQKRVDEVGVFYNTTDTDIVKEFLKRYNVKYMVVGQMERAIYSPEGISKFIQLDGILWREVYHDGSTAIYKVIE